VCDGPPASGIVNVASLTPGAAGWYRTKTRQLSLGPKTVPAHSSIRISNSVALAPVIVDADSSAGAEPGFTTLHRHDLHPDSDVGIRPPDLAGVDHDASAISGDVDPNLTDEGRRVSLAMLFVNDPETCYGTVRRGRYLIYSETSGDAVTAPARPIDIDSGTACLRKDRCLRADVFAGGQLLAARSSKDEGEVVAEGAPLTRSVT
jgi:hypothetical protein